MTGSPVVMIVGEEKMSERVVMDQNGIARTLMRLAREIAEREDLGNGVLMGIRRGGEIVAKRLKDRIAEAEGTVLPCFGIDIGMKRDDLVSAFFLPEYTSLETPVAVDGKTVILCDDVLNTGRSVRAAIEEILGFGRPKAIRLAEMVDRGGRELPVRADFVGKNLPAARGERVRVCFTELGAKEDKIVIGKGERE